MGKVKASASRVPTRSARVPTASSHNPFYSSKEWKDLVEEVIRERGRVCEEMQCARRFGRDGKPIRLIADHIIEIRDGGARLDKSNIKLVCFSCHSLKTARERANRMARRW